MATLHLLGTGGGRTTADRTTTMLALSNDDHCLLVDCGGDVVQRVLAAGLDVESIDGMIVTHEHPDHVAGFPLFIEKIWLAGRRHPIPVYGIAQAIDQARRCWDVFDTSRWTGVPEIEWNEIAYEENAPVIDDERWKITASPGVHGAPVVGLRIESKRTGGVVTYSSDTEPCDSIARLSRSADILVHEANGKGPGHASAGQAAETARKSGASHLILVHLPAEISADDLEEARQLFPSTELGEDLRSFDF